MAWLLRIAVLLKWTDSYIVITNSQSTHSASGKSWCERCSQATTQHNNQTLLGCDAAAKGKTTLGFRRRARKSPGVCLRFQVRTSMDLRSCPAGRKRPCTDPPVPLGITRVVAFSMAQADEVRYHAHVFNTNTTRLLFCYQLAFIAPPFRDKSTNCGCF
jgi:hypothetical protein